MHQRKISTPATLWPQRSGRGHSVDQALLTLRWVRVIAWCDGALIANTCIRPVDAQLATAVVMEDLRPTTDGLGLCRRYSACALAPWLSDRPCSVVALYHVARVGSAGHNSCFLLPRHADAGSVLSFGWLSDISSPGVAIAPKRIIFVPRNLLTLSESLLTLSRISTSANAADSSHQRHM
jgi:hypothetical protein